MNINTNVLNQLKAFNDFAKSSDGNNDAVAKLGGARPGSNVTLVARNATDKPRWLAAFFRSPDNKQQNNTIRDLFKNTIAQLFGGEENIPQEVKDAMHFNRFDGKGRPLTARRIKAVNIAVIDALRTSHATGISDQNGNTISAESVKAVLEGKTTPANDKVLRGIETGNSENMPQDIKDALAAMKDKINARCGAGTVKNLDGVMSFVGKYPLKEAMMSAAKGLVRDLNGADMTTAMDDILAGESRVFEDAKLIERLKVLAKDVEGATIDRAMAKSMYQAIPGLLDGLKACRTPDAYKATLDKFEPQIRSRMEISAMLNQCETKAADILFVEFGKLSGLDPKTLVPPIQTHIFASREVNALKTDINSGKVAVKTAEDVKKAFVKLAQDFVTVRQALAAQVDEHFKGLPDWALEHLRRCALVAPKPKEFIMGGAKQAMGIDLQPLKTAISAKPFNTNDAAVKMFDVMRKIYDIGVTLLGKREWDDLGLEGQAPFARLMLKAALANDAELVGMINPHSGEISSAVHRRIEDMPEDDLDNKQVISISAVLPDVIMGLVDAMPKTLS